MDVDSSWTIDPPTSSALQTPLLPLYETESISTPSPPSPSEDDVSSSTTIAPKAPQGSDIGDSQRPPSPQAHLEGEYIAHEFRRWYSPFWRPPLGDPQLGAQAQSPFYLPTPPGLTREYGRRFIPDMPPPRARDDQLPPPSAQAQVPAYVPMPPGPTVVQLPMFDTLIEILREHRMAQLATVDQQRELTRYMNGLTDWLARDVQDRQAELRSVTARIDQLREDLNRLVVGVAPAQPQAADEGAGGPVFSPSSAGTPVPMVVPTAYPAGFVPHVLPQPPTIPAMEQSPYPHSPILLEPPGWGTPDSSRSDGRMSPVRLPETAYEEYLPSGISFITIMHTLAVITAIVLALAAFCRAQIIQVKCQYDLSSTVESSASIAGSAYSDGTAKAAYYSNGSSVGVQEGLSDALGMSVGGLAITHAASGDVVIPSAGSQFPVNASKTSAPNTAPVLPALATVVGGTLLGAWLTCQSNRQS